MQKRSSSAVRIFYPRFKREEVIERIRAGLKALGENLPLESGILFGSYAKDNYTVGSDIDLLIIYKGKRREEIYSLSKRLLGILGLEPHVYCSEEYEEMKQTIDRMAKDGIVLFP
ncbi:MAG: nucleotidyltransferase domain-containing protein [bacterium]